PGLLHGHAVDGLELGQRVVLAAVALGADGLLLRLLAVARRLDLTGDRVTLAQAVALDHAHRDVHVVRAGQVAGGADEGVVVEDVEDARDGDEHVVLVDLRLDVVELLTAATTLVPVAVAVPVAPATAALLAVVAATLVLVAAAVVLPVVAAPVVPAPVVVAVALVLVAAAVVLTVVPATVAVVLTVVPATVAVLLAVAAVLPATAARGAAALVRR